MNISVFSNAYNTKPEATCPFLAMLADIKRGKFAGQMAAVRAAHLAGDFVRKDTLKKNLKAFTVAGVFAERKNEALKELSNFLVLDFDAVENIATVRVALEQDPHIFAMFVSTSGNGLKVFLKIDGKKHTQTFRASVAYFKSRHGLAADESGKDISRLCFVSDDPETFVNETAEPFAVADEPPQSLITPAELSAPKKLITYKAALRRDVEAALAEIQWPLPNIKWKEIIWAVESEFGAAEAAAMVEAAAGPCKPGDRTTLQIASEGAKKISIGTLFFIAKQFVFTERHAEPPPSDEPMPYDLPEDLQPLDAVENMEADCSAMNESRQPTTLAGIPAFQTIDAASLMRKHFEPLRFAVEGLVPEGLTLLAGRMKIGKSWLLLELATAIATHTKAFGTFGTVQGDVLVLALEDGERRLQGRLRKLGFEPSEKIHFATDWRRLNEGGIEDLKAWISSHPKGVVFIDGFVKISPRQNSKSKSSDYEFVYDSFKPILDLSKTFGVAIVLIHHTRKGNGMDGDVLDEIIGSSGYAAAVDNTLVLKRKRKEEKATLYLSGRDVIEKEYELKFDAETCRWEYIGEAPDNPKDEPPETKIGETRRAVLTAIDQLVCGGKPSTPEEISKLTSINPNTVRQHLFKAVGSGQAVSLSDGGYAIATGFALWNNTRNGHNAVTLEKVVNSDEKEAKIDSSNTSRYGVTALRQDYPF